MGTAATLFKVFDIEVRVHWSFVLILAYGAFAYSSGARDPLTGALYGVLVILLLFVSSSGESSLIGAMANGFPTTVC